LGWSYEDLIACLLVERLLQLQLAKPYMLAHFMPVGLTAQQLVARLPQRVQAVLSQQIQPVVKPPPPQQQQGEDAGMGEALQTASDTETLNSNEQQEQPDMDWMAFAVDDAETDVSDNSCAASLLKLSGQSMLLPLQQQAAAAAAVGGSRPSSFVMERPRSLLVPGRLTNVVN
jgi:hypothetical protein